MPTDDATLFRTTFVASYRAALRDSDRSPQHRDWAWGYARECARRALEDAKRTGETLTDAEFAAVFDALRPEVA
jgi:hypothetical protein